MSYAQPPSRFSVLSNSSLSSASISLPPPGVRPNIYDRPLAKTRNAEVSAAAFAFLFSEVVQYTQKRVVGSTISNAGQLNTLGYRIGTRVLELMTWRNENASKAPKREIRFLPALMSIHTHIWRAVFGKPADAIEKSVENVDECTSLRSRRRARRSLTVPPPSNMSTLSCSSFTAGVVEAVLDGLGFSARVTAHNTPTERLPNKTTILIKLEKSVLEREEALKT
ncbi:transporter particle subunit trs31 [Epithele typhae]|uniref:transporter particle subunit trs31 n=1 Tax=Epithele typhae TaxID=378194 RepID=UPI002007825E|nr:transporter particle subunit trs31 [Epithele typhae]KAH9927450.1 transporter particle subunit trs31 [Epithele typhae]